MTRNTSISLGPVGWLIVGPFILVAVAAFWAGFALCWFIYWAVVLTVRAIVLAVKAINRRMYQPAHK